MQQPPQPQPAPQPGQTVLIQQQPGQAPVAATVAVLKRPPSTGMLAPQSGQQPIAVMMKVDPSQPGAATMVVPATGAAALLPAALAGGTPVQVVQQVSAPSQVALQAVAESGAAILQVQQPLQSQEPTEAAAAAATTTDRQGGQQVNTLPQAFEKKLRRLEKNRESARECRRRKKEHVLELQKQVALLEAENLRLKLQLKVGEESEAQERQEKARITKKLDEMVKSGASEADIWQTIDMFKERYSDYGSDRRSAIEFHTNQLEKLLLPTKLTKLCMWMLLNMDIGDGAAGSALALPSPAEAVASVPALELKAEEQAGGIMAPPLQASSEAAAAAGGEEQAPAQAQAQVLAGAGAGPEKGPAAAAAARRLWATVSAELGVTEEQQRQLLAQRETVKGMDGDLQVTSGMLSELRALINDKNASLDQELLEVQKILTPTQTAKFILWITKNPACMHMLNQLWRLVYEKAPLPAPGAGAGSGPGAALGGAEMEEPPAAKRAKVDGSASGSRNGNGAAATAAAAATQVAGPS